MKPVVALAVLSLGSLLSGCGVNGWLADHEQSCRKYPPSDERVACEQRFKETLAASDKQRAADRKGFARIAARCQRRTQKWAVLQAPVDWRDGVPQLRSNSPRLPTVGVALWLVYGPLHGRCNGSHAADGHSLSGSAQKRFTAQSMVNQKTSPCDSPQQFINSFYREPP